MQVSRELDCELDLPGGWSIMDPMRLKDWLPVVVAAAALALEACSPGRETGDADAAIDPPADEGMDDPRPDPPDVTQDTMDLPETDAAASPDGPRDRIEEDLPPVCDLDDPQPPPAETGIVWDPRLSGTGEETLGGYGHDDGLGPVGWCGSGARPHWGLVEALFQSDEDGESGGNHNIYLEVLDESGARIVGQEVIVSNGVESWSVLTEDKPPPEYAANYPMWGGNVYSARVAGDADTVFNMRLPNNHHVNFLLTFRRIP
jgi:hypothetical protein